MDHALDARFDRLRQDLRQDIQASADQLRQGLRQEFRQDIQASAVETRRHFDVIAESLRSEIQVVAEGLGMLDETVERFRDEVHQEFGKVDGGFCTWTRGSPSWSAASPCFAFEVAMSS